MAIPEPRYDPALLPIGVGAGLCRLLGERFALDTRLKWPNDVLVRMPDAALRKLAGVLVDRVPSPAFGMALVVGIGINVAIQRSVLPEELSGRVAILSELVDRHVGPEEVEPVAIVSIERAAGRLSSSEGARTLWEECRAALYGVGERVRVDGRVAGVMRDLAEDGALLIDRDGTIETVRSGQVEVEGGP